MLSNTLARLAGALVPATPGPEHFPVPLPRTPPQVVSLHSFGAALEGCCAASYGGGIAVWQVGTLSKLLSGGRPTNPRAVWKVRQAAGGWRGVGVGTPLLWEPCQQPTAAASSPHSPQDCTG